MDEREQEIVELSRLIREHLAWEDELQGQTIPRWAPPSPHAAHPDPPPPPLAAPPPDPDPPPPPLAAPPPDPDPPPPRLAAPPPDPDPPPPPLTAPDPAPAPARPPPTHRLELLAAEAAACTLCRLHAGRTRSVFSRGSPTAEIAFVGEGPGFHEDQQGLPFVGPAGQLLDKMIVAMGLDRDEVYVCNVVKCRPPENRTPLPDEAAACDRYLTPQLELVAPKVIVALGRCAAENLRVAEPGRSWRGTWGTWKGFPVMPTYHPAFLLRSPEMKRPVWEDLQKVLVRLGRTPPSRKP